jgi:hypothetical protein
MAGHVPSRKDPAAIPIRNERDWTKSNTDRDQEWLAPIDLLP